jgi:general stress protein 26
MDCKNRVWEILEHTPIGMLTTRFAAGLRARPLDGRPDRMANAIFFVTDVRGFKDNEIGNCPDACFTVVDEKDKAYLSITGRAEILQNEALARRIWKEADTVWWPGGPQDTNVRVLRLDPQIAELWDGPASSVVASFEFAKARLTGAKPNLGENRKVTVDM